MENLREIALHGGLAVADGALDRLTMPIAYVHGAESEIFKAEGTERFADQLRAVCTVVPDYGHLDLLIGQNAAADVYPVIQEQLARASAAVSA